MKEDIKVVGKHTPVTRLVTKLYSLDHAFINKDGDIGIPVGVGYEIFGLNHTGKSTFAYSLAATIAAKMKGDFALADFEGFDDQFLRQVARTQGFRGTIYLISEDDDEDQLDELIRHLTKKACVGILDSIGAIAPMGELKGEIGEANMGKRAFLMAQFSRKMLKLFRSGTGGTVLMINHWYPKMGGYGYDTPGGEAKKYLASVRIKLQRKEEFPDKSYALQGTVIKNRWGYQGNTFQVFMLAGYGMHPGMTALWDCVAYKIVRREKGTGNLRLGEENLGKLGHYARDAKQGNTERFDLFYRLLEDYGNTHQESEETDTDNGPEDIFEDPGGEPDGEPGEKSQELDSVED